MELIMINENKLKLILSQNEMQKYGLDENEFHLCISNSRQILERILENYDERDELKDFTKSAKLLMQLYPDKDGGCELYVTRLYIENTSLESEAQKGSSNLALLPLANTKKEAQNLCYSFLNFSDMISACRAIYNPSLNIASSLFISDEKKPYLFISKPSGINKKSHPFSNLLEFGELENCERASLFLLERGYCAIKNGAIEILAAM